MERIEIHTGSNASEIMIGESRKNAGKYLSGRKGVIITDENVNRLYHGDFPDFPVFTIEPGEAGKSLETIGKLTCRLLDARLDRSGFILGIGGGVVCDVTGFLASIYMRGVPFGFISTSLLSQVDASVGGKNGVNACDVKNVLGTFMQPDFVICDTSMLSTLPEEEYMSGLAEIIKMGFIRDSSLLDRISGGREAILSRDAGFMGSLIADAVRLKAGIVTEDEKESGVRMILNFGHTFGHVIEAAGGQKHGYAVASGMVIAAAISVREKLLPEKDFSRLTAMLNDFNLLVRHDVTAEQFRQFILRDKKKKGNEISFVLIAGSGRAVVRKMDIDRLIGFYEMISGQL